MCDITAGAVGLAEPLALNVANLAADPMGSTFGDGIVMWENKL